MTDLKVGSLIKIHILGETPWAEVVKIHDPEVLDVRIDNYVGKNTEVANMLERRGLEVPHNHQIDDVTTVVWIEKWNQFSTEWKGFTND